MNKNYFKTRNGRFFFFHDAVPESVESAYLAALFEDDAPTIFRPAVIAGPWDLCPIVGHRPRADVLRELATEQDEELVAILADELVAIEDRFADVGRSAPLQAVAA